MNVSVVAVALPVTVAVVRLFCVRSHGLNNLFSDQRYRIRGVAAVVLVCNLENDLRPEPRLLRGKNRNFDLVAHRQAA